MIAVGNRSTNDAQIAQKQDVLARELHNKVS